MYKTDTHSDIIFLETEKELDEFDEIPDRLFLSIPYECPNRSGKMEVIG